MTYPQQPGGWSDPTSSSSDQPAGGSPQQSSPAGGSPPPSASPPPGQPEPTLQYPSYGDPASPNYEASAPTVKTPASGYPPPGSYPPAPAYPPPAPVPPYGYLPPPPNRPTNGLSIAALVVSCVGAIGLCAYGLGGFIGAIGAILGHVSRRQIRERDEGGDGMALAGIIVGWIATGLFVLAAAAWITFIVWVANNPEDFDSNN